MDCIDIIAALWPGKPVTATDATTYGSLIWADGSPIAQTTLDGQRVAAAKVIRTGQITAQLATALAGPVSYNGFQWDTDSRAVEFVTSQTIALTAILLTPPNTVWHDSAGVTHTFAKADFLSLHAALTTWRNACYAVSWQLKAQVAAMTTESAVWALDIVTPFPTSYTAAQTVMAGTIP